MSNWPRMVCVTEQDALDIQWLLDQETPSSDAKSDQLVDRWRRMRIYDEPLSQMVLVEEWVTEIGEAP